MNGQWSLSGIIFTAELYLFCLLHNHNCRFVNLVNMIGNEDTAWDIVKDLRKSSTSEFDCTCSKYAYGFSSYSYLVVSFESVKKNVKEIEKRMNMNVTSKSFPSISRETIDAAGEMFTYLTFCSNEISSMSNFYKSVLGKSSAKDILLSSLDKIKSSSSVNRKAAFKIWRIVTERLGLNNYKVTTKEYEAFLKNLSLHNGSLPGIQGKILNKILVEI